MSRPVARDDDLDRRLTPFLAVMGRSTRRHWGPLYVRGLLGPDGPKSMQPIASRLGLRGHDQLHHFVSSPAWDDAPLWRVLAERADAQVGGEDRAGRLRRDNVSRSISGASAGWYHPESPHTSNSVSQAAHVSATGVSVSSAYPGAWMVAIGAALVAFGARRQKGP